MGDITGGLFEQPGFIQPTSAAPSPHVSTHSWISLEQADTGLLRLWRPKLAGDVTNTTSTLQFIQFGCTTWMNKMNLRVAGCVFIDSLLSLTEPLGAKDFTVPKPLVSALTE